MSRVARIVFDKIQQNAIHDTPLSLKISNPEKDNNLRAKLRLGKFISEKFVSPLETVDITDLFFKIRRKGYSFQPRNGQLKFEVELYHNNEIIFADYSLRILAL